MTIGEMEVHTGLDRATIRFYEREGLLSPRRLENGYRDYSDEDRNTLLRIKLLRELGVSLEEIRALQQGTAALPHTLGVRLEALERELAATVDARETCRAIRDEGVSYGSLDAEKYLNRSSWTPTPVQDAPPPPYCPWRRYFARMLDLSLYHLAVLAVACMGLRLNISKIGTLGPTLLTVLAMVLMLLTEPLLLHWFGTTVGKAILGLRVERLDGGRLTYSEGLTRTWGVIAKGLGFRLPIYDWYRLFRSYKHHTEGWEMPWDWENDFHLEAKEGAWWRNGLLAAAYTAMVAASIVCYIGASFPPHFGLLTPAQFAENYNFLANFYGRSLYLLDENGQWVWRNSREVAGETSASWPAVTLETGADGTVEAVTAQWQYDGEDLLAYWQEDTMTYLALAYGAGTGSWGSYWGLLLPVQTAVGDTGFQDYAATVRGMDLRWDVEQTGFMGGGDMLLPDGDGAASCTVIYTIRSK